MAAKRKTPRPVVRGKLWVTVGTTQALTDAGADLLEQIEACGSVSQAAKQLQFAYRRAWLLVDGMNQAWPSPLVVKTTGGKQGGGATLTEAGRRVLHAYRDLQIHLEHFLDSHGKAFEGE